MTIRCLSPARSSEKHVTVQHPPWGLTGSSGAKIRDLDQLLNMEYQDMENTWRSQVKSAVIRVLGREREGLPV